MSLKMASKLALHPIPKVVLEVNSAEPFTSSESIIPPENKDSRLYRLFFGVENTPLFFVQTQL